MKQLLAAMISLIATSSVAAAQDVYITEFLAQNETGLVDEDGDHTDWVELYNATASDITLTGWTLSDDAGEPGKWTFPGEVLPAGTFLIVFASDKDRGVAGAQLHTNFKLSGGGEFLGLFRADGSVATEYAPEYPDQSDDVSYGIEVDFVTRGFFSPPTPGLFNGISLQSLPPITSSRGRGVYSSAFSVELRINEPNASIYFTLDGRVPTEADTLLVSPLTIDGTTTLRARAFAPGAFPSAVLSQTFIYADEIATQSVAGALVRGLPADWIQETGLEWSVGGLRPGSWYGVYPSALPSGSASALGDALTSLPILSLQMHPDDLMGHMSPSGRDGIYVNSQEESEFWDRACSIEWIDPTGGPEFQVDCGTGIQGGTSTTVLLRSQLSMSLKFKSEFGPSKLEFDLLPGSGIDRFDYLVMDAGHQFSVNEPAGVARKQHAQEARDRFMADLLSEMGHLNPDGRNAHLFLNGLYWGVYYLHERADERFAAEHLGGEPEEFDWVKVGVVRNGNDGAVGSATPGLWPEIVDIVAGGVASGTMWQGEDAFAALARRVDLTNYVDYMLSNWYGGNRDWPDNNWMGTAHARTSANFADVNPNGRFSFQVWDAESVLFSGARALAVGDGDYDRTGVRSNDPTNIAFIHTAALAHPEYTQLFKDRVHVHLKTPGGAMWVEPGFDTAGTIYDPAFPERNVPASLYHPLAAELQPAIELEYARWSQYWPLPMPITAAMWLTERDRLLNDYFPVRSQVILQQLGATSPTLLTPLDPPTLTLDSGSYKVGTTTGTGQAQGADVYYTLDGSDPRASLGGIASTATLSSGPVALQSGLLLMRARAFDGTHWSPMAERSYGIGLRLRINEIQADNGMTIADQAGEFDDWFEILNATNQPIDLGGFYVSDDPTNPRKHQLAPGVIVPARGHMILWADSDLGQGIDHVDFKLSGSGEYVGLYAPDSIGNELIDGTDFVGLPTDSVYARIPNAIGFFRHMALSSPGTLNRLPTPAGIR